MLGSAGDSSEKGGTTDGRPAGGEPQKTVQLTVTISGGWWRPLIFVFIENIFTLLFCLKGPVEWKVLRRAPITGLLSSCLARGLPVDASGWPHGRGGVE